MYRLRDGMLEVYLAHPGGPFFQYKDNGHWTIPKGEVAPGEELLATAIREFKEETGLESRGEYIPLGHIRQRGGKIVHGWAFAGDPPDGKMGQLSRSGSRGILHTGAIASKDERHPASVP